MHGFVPAVIRQKRNGMDFENKNESKRTGNATAAGSMTPGFAFSSNETVSSLRGK